MDKNELYQNLYKARASLREKFYSNGRRPTICTDEALKNLAQQAPREKDDMYAIVGLGKTFIEKYGDYFMIYLNKYHQSNANAKELQDDVRKTLCNLENRLINISKKNRLLYLGKATNKYAVDLFSDDEMHNQKVVDMLLGKVAHIVLCERDISDKKSAENKYFDHVSSLLREVTSSFKESGQYDLYVGYPFVIGKALVDDFNIRAPLMLFPISFDKQVNKITIKLDKARNILYNSNLTISQSKFLGENKELPSATIEEFSANDYSKNMLDYYDQCQISISGEISSYEKFAEYTDKNFPKLNKGEFKLVGNAVLGMFSLYSTAIQRDFRKITNSDEINTLVNDLLIGADDDNFMIDDIETEQQTEVVPVSERELNYINDLNSSQEQAVLNIAQNDKLVIQGPPGTGKSQTITSLISDSVCKANNVLMVSQKKAALDVIYSRLGELSKYAILLSDTKNKELFYSQLNTLFSSTEKPVYNSGDFLKYADLIDNKVLKFDEIAQSFKTKTSGIDMCNGYIENTNNIFRNENETENQYLSLIDKTLIEIDYEELKAIKEKLLKDDIAILCKKYLDIIAENQWLQNIKSDLSAMEIKYAKKDFSDFCENQKSYFEKNIFAKIFQYSKRIKQEKEILSKYFINKNNKKLLFKNAEKFVDGIDLYSTFEKTKKVYKELTENDLKFVLTSVKFVEDNRDIKESIKMLFDLIVKFKIEIFEDERKGVVENISKFDANVEKVNQTMGLKKQTTIEKTRSILQSNFEANIHTAKRFQEMKRQVESSRKPSINKFLTKFDMEMFKGVKIWLMTPETVSEILPLTNGLFDLLIFDEASQIYIEKGVPSVCRAKKVVIVGDSKQLRPSSLGFGRIVLEEDEIEDNAALEEESLLDLARFKYPTVMLNYHYRAKYEELINFSNYAFYNAKLNVAPNVEEPENPPIEFVKVDNAVWENRSNKKEAMKVVALVKNLLLNRKEKETIGVVTFNVSQKDLILDLLEKECINDAEFSKLYKKECERTNKGEDVSLFVKNIENVQGDERDIIIFSSGYAKNKEGVIVRNFGWLNQQGGENRLNVAISRAKKKIVFVTSILPEELVVDDLTNSGPKLLRKYMEYCYAISKKDNNLVKQILNSLINKKVDLNTNKKTCNAMQMEIIEDLKEKGFDVAINVGIGGYTFEIAIKNKDKYVIGIECDDELYKQDMTTRERDIYKENYFASRGWNIYRVWSKNWWHSKNTEIENIKKLYSKIVSKN